VTFVMCFKILNEKCLEGKTKNKLIGLFNLLPEKRKLKIETMQKKKQTNEKC